MISRLMMTAFLLLLGGSVASAEETFVKIHQVVGNRMLVSKEAGAGGGQGGAMAGRGRRRGGASQPKVTVTLPANVKVTSAMRERRTFEFRVLGELPGGFRHQVFRNLKEPVSARIVTTNNRITEVNVITGETDINQSGSNAAGQTVIAVRPKRPPMKRQP